LRQGCTGRRKSRDQEQNNNKNQQRVSEIDRFENEFAATRRVFALLGALVLVHPCSRQLNAAKPESAFSQCGEARVPFEVEPEKQYDLPFLIFVPHEEREEKGRKIGGKTPVSNVIKIRVRKFSRGMTVQPHGSRRLNEPGTGAEIGADRVAPKSNLEWAERARPHEAHFSPDHIHQLWELVNSGIMQKTYTMWYRRFVVSLPLAKCLDCGAMTFVADCCKCDDIEHFTFETDAGLPSKQRAGSANFQSGCGDEKDGESKNDKNRGKQNVE
jgi:hypothetical protein